MDDQAPPAARRADRKFKFTMERLQRLPPHDEKLASRSTEYSDTAEPGLKFIVSRSSRNFAHRAKLDGRHKYAPLGPFPSTTLEEARHRAHERNVAIFQGKDPNAARSRLREMPIFAEYSKEYLRAAALRKRNIGTDKSKLETRLLAKFGPRRLCDIQTVDINEYHQSLRKTLKPSSANRELALLSSIFRYAVDNGVLDRNPCKGVKQFKEDNGRTRFLSNDELRRLVTVLRASALHPAAEIVLLLLLTAMRRGECLGAKWVDFDATTKQLRLPMTKSDKVRFVNLNDAAVKIIESLPSRDKSVWLFPGTDPTKPYVEPKKAFRNFLKAAEITEHMRLHDIRHSAASILVNSGGTLFEAQNLLGHASPKMSQRYAHLQHDSMRKASQRIADAIENVMSGTPA